MEKNKHINWWLGGLMLLTVLVYSQALSHSWVAWDDDWFVQENPVVKDLSIPQIAKAFTSYYKGQYSPLTGIIMGLEYQASKGSPSLLHLFSIIFHLINAFLVYKLSLFVMKQHWPALLISAIFLLHPLQAESIGWISAQKVLIYASFFLLSLYAYTRYLQSNYQIRYLIYTFLFFILSFLAKEQAFMLSVSLIAFDYLHNRKLLSARVIYEKIPFLAVSFIMGLITLASVKTGEFYLADKEKPDFLIQVVYSAYSYFLYIYQSILPYGLSAFYPYPNEVDKSDFPGYFYLGILLLAGLVYLVIRNFNKKPVLIFGILFFSINILPVLQVMPLRDFMIADRYVYLPIIGLSMALLSLFTFQKNVKKKPTLLYVTLGISLIYGVLSYQRNSVWKDSIYLFSDVVEKYPESSIGLNNKGLALQAAGREEEAVADFKQAIQSNPNSLFAYNNISIALVKLNRNDEALDYLNKAISLRKEFAQAYYNRGDLYSKTGQYELAYQDYSSYLNLRPDDGKAYISRGIASFRLKKTEAALKDLNEAVRIFPSESSYLNRGVIYLNTKQYQQAIEDFTTTLKYRPQFNYAYFNRGICQVLSGNQAAGCKDLEAARQLGFPQADQAIKQYCSK